MRILIVHECFPPDYRGGGEYVMLRVAQGLQAAGHEVRVLTTGDPAISHHEGVQTERLPMRRPLLALAAGAVTRAAAWADVIYACTYFGLRPASLAARRSGKPLVLCVLALFDDIWLQTKGPLRGRLYRAVERRWLALPAAARVFLSPPSMAIAHSHGAARRGDVVVPPGIERQHFQPRPGKAGVAFAGKFEKRKGVDLVLQAALRHPNLPFTLVGWGERFDEIRSQAPVNVQVLAFEGHALLGRVLGGASVFLFPTLAETFGLAVAEAMAAGCAVVSSAPLPFEGERVDPADPEAVLAALAGLLADPARCERQGHANQALAQVYDWQRHVASLLDVFETARAPEPETPRKAARP